jgi:hypothetical protein
MSSQSDKKSDIAPNSGEVISINEQGQKLDDSPIVNDFQKNQEKPNQSNQDNSKQDKKSKEESHDFREAKS